MTIQTTEAGEEAKDKVTAMDIAVLAAGYWGRYFNYRIYRKTLAPIIVTAVGVAILILIGILHSITSIGSDGSDILSLVSIVAAMIGTVAALLIYTRDKEAFIDECIYRWEHGDTRMPETSTVVEFANRR